MTHLTFRSIPVGESLTLLIDVMAAACLVGGIYRTSELHSRFACTALHVCVVASRFIYFLSCAWYAIREHSLAQHLK